MNTTDTQHPEGQPQMSTENLYISTLNVTIETWSRPSIGASGISKKSYPAADFLSREVMEIDGYTISFQEKTPHSLKGNILFDNRIECGKFSLDNKNCSFSTGFLSLCYDIQMDLTLEIKFSSQQPIWTPKKQILDLFEEPIKSILKRIQKYVDFPNPICKENIIRCNTELRKNGFPELPEDYAEFLLKMNGFAFNSVELYGDMCIPYPDDIYVLPDILSENEQMRNIYGEQLKNCLIIGRDDEDYYIFNSQTRKYEIHSHECYNDIWDEWSSFEELFVNNVGKYLQADDNDDDGRYDAWS